MVDEDEREMREVQKDMEVHGRRNPEEGTITTVIPSTSHPGRTQEGNTPWKRDKMSSVPLYI